MHEETLYPKTKQTLQLIKGIGILESFYLAGGTSLALQLGHRKSVDLDFFSARFPDNEQIIQSLKGFHPTILQNKKGTVDMTLNETKVSFSRYEYPLLKPLVEYQSYKLASVLDIACMKISAISSRGTKKDFVDIFVILKEYPLADILRNFEKKYREVKFQKLHLLKSLIYFDDADTDPDPDYVHPIKWSVVKNRLTTEIKKLI